MKLKLLAPALVAAAILSLLCTCVSAAGAARDVQSVADGILAFNQKEYGASSVRQFIDGALADGAGKTSEWYIIAIAQGGEEYDFSRYVSSLADYISSHESIGATTRQKYALALLSCGYDADYIQKTADETIGALGLMSKIFGLHLLNNGVKSEKYTKNGLIDEILSSQLQDGGFALTGSVGDIDVTAMALAALAPNAAAHGVGEAIDMALEMLSSRQFDNGGFKSMMSEENPESAAQVLLALSSLGIDCEKDERFIKNGTTVIDAMMRFRREDGSFSHTEGGEYNMSATVQVFYSLISYIRMQEGKTPLLILDRAANAEYVDLSGRSTERSVTETGVPLYKPIATAALVLIFAAVCIALFALKKRNAKNFIAAAVILLLLILAVWLTDIKTPDQYYGKDIVKQNPVGSVTMTIRCDTIVGKSTAGHIPKDGVVLDMTEFEIENGESAYDILAQAARKYGLSIDVSSVGYVSGIAYIYELDFGSLSGWMYYVNGESPSVSCNKFILSDGDVIEWLYTCDIGNDLKKQ